MREKRLRLSNIILHQDAYGRFYFDTCGNDLDHILAPTPPGQERRSCRVYLDNERVFGGMIGQRGTFEIDIKFVPEQHY